MIDFPYLLLSIVFLLLLALFIPIHRMAKGRAQTPRLWEGILLLLWTLIWMGIHFFRANLSQWSSLSSREGTLAVALGMSLSLGVYVLLWLLLKRKPRLKAFEDKLNEIGDPPQHPDQPK